MGHPYSSLLPLQFWSSAMAWPAPGQVDPVSKSLHIRPEQRVATMGSCFAQHISRALAAAGGTYFVSERPDSNLTAEQAQRRNYNVFSARYGNVYTVRQAVQLFDRAFGHFKPTTEFWQRGAHWVDPFRPEIEPEGFPSIEALTSARDHHLGCVQAIFKKSDYIVFTLGLTEAWRDRIDGAVFPLAPGVSGGEFTASQHEFINFTVTEVRDDLFAFIDRVGEVNAHCQIILTVSPVPLIATFEGRHVLVSNTFSKAALRVAADEAERRYKNVIYFPAYEIITSPAASGRYYADNFREVTGLGVQHVMRLFFRHFLSVQRPAGEFEGKVDAGRLPMGGIVCDEETIERSMKIGGFSASVKT